MDWSIITLIAVVFIFSGSLLKIILNSPPAKAWASRIAGKSGDPALSERIEMLEKKLSRKERADQLAQRVGKEETDLIKREMGPSQGTVTILFSDIENFTRFVDRNDELGHEILQIHNRIVRDQIKSHDGLEVKNYGDGFMVSFSSARKAVQCSLDIQEIFKTYNFKHMEPIRVRIGINSGEPIQEHGDYIGRTVNMAARIADCARGGEIWVSDIVRNLVGPSRDFQFVERGTHSLQGFTEMQNLCEVVKIEALESPEKHELEQRLMELEARLKREIER
jgi:class 3 adenylate cyclase